MEIGMQDDQAIVYRWHDRPLALQQFREVGGTRVRINVMHRYGPERGPQDRAADALEHPIAEYDAAIDAIRDAGLLPQLTLVWYGQSDPGATAAWMANAAAHFGAGVDRYSVLDEPDLTIPAADDCDARTIRELIDDGSLAVAYRNVRTKIYLRRRVRVRRAGKVFRAWRPVYVTRVVPTLRRSHIHFVRRKFRRYRWGTKRVAMTHSLASSRVSETLSLAQGCQKLIRGRRYRAIFQAAASAIRDADPGAQVLAGETSPVFGLDVFLKQALPVDADGWAHHPYQWDLQPERPAGGYGIGDTARVASLVGMPLYFTEFGYPRPGSEWERERFAGRFTEQAIADVLPRAWRAARADGVRQMVQFGWYSPDAGWQGSWDTALHPLR